MFFRELDKVSVWTAVRQLPGVRRVLEQDGAPALLSDLVIRQLRRRVVEGRMRPPGQRLSPGDRVVIERGPLAPLDAIFDCVRLMGRELPISIDPAYPKRLAG